MSLSLSTRVYPVLACLTLGAMSVATACMTFSGITDVDPGGAGGSTSGNGAQTGNGSGPATSGAGPSATSGSQTGSTSTSGAGPGVASSSAAGPGPGSSVASSGAGPGASSSSSAAAASSSSSGGGPDASQICVDTINMYRATLGLPPYARWGAEESCAQTQGMKDYQTMTPHSAFPMCGENAQNECPDWPGPPDQMIPQCLAQMWAEGPGPFNGHGHYINMSSMQYTMVACGFYTTPLGKIWAVQDFK